MSIPQPTALRPQFEHFPDELRELPQWVLWKFDFRKGKWTKPPRTIQKGAASVTDPRTWSDYSTVVDVYLDGWADGVGFVLTPEVHIIALDFDDCTPEAARPFLFPNSYAELSPSGAGIRQFIRGNLPQGTRNNYHLPGMKKLEIYDRARFMTVTGHRL